MSQKESKLKQYASGMVRENKDEKIDYTLAVDGPMFGRYAAHMTNGARRHGSRNWLKACGEAELCDFKAGAFRHMVQWLRGDNDEDHAAAIIFNLNGAELIKEKLCNAGSPAKDRTPSDRSPLQLSVRELEAMQKKL